MDCKSKTFLFVFVAACSYAIIMQSASHACTLWAAAGERVEGSGTILAKNRDFAPQQSELRIVIPKTGFRYFGLFSSEGNVKYGPAAGINEKGLAVVSATAGSISHKKRNIGAKRLIENILAAHDSVDAVLAGKTVFVNSRPAFYMIADKSKIAVIEVAPQGLISIRTNDNGVLFHTNHYLDENLLHANDKIAKGSITRVNRIEKLLNDHLSGFTIDDFVALSGDANDGPDESIWRTGSATDKVRTLATWIVYIPKQGPPEFSVKLANPEEPVRIYNLILDTPFWTEGTELN